MIVFQVRQRPQPKVSFEGFHPVRILGEGGFRKMILAKKKATDQRFAVKFMKKCHIISCCSVSYTIIEKEALILASGHPFITMLYSCFQTKVIFNFLKLLHIYRVINTEIYHQFENVMFRCICKIAKIDYELLHVCLAVCLSVCVERLCSHWTHFH